MVIRGVVFDVDDTLYLERDYVRSGFEYVARLTAIAPGEREALAGWLWRAFEAGVRGDTFDRFLAAHSALAGRFTVDALVDAYRAHRPKISMLPGMTNVLSRLRERVIRIAVLSDGPMSSQSSKAEALQLEKWFEPVLLTAGQPGYAKPATAGFERIASDWGLAHAELAYVADNPHKDFIGPRILGWRTIRLRIPGQLHEACEPRAPSDAPDLEVRDLDALSAALGPLAMPAHIE